MDKTNRTVLLIDDSTIIQTLCAKIFYGMDIQLIGNKTGKNVISSIEDQNVDLVILDIILPHCNGLQIAKQIRSHSDQKIANLPIIVVSGNYNNYKSEDFVKLNIQDYLIKPLDYDNLVRSVKKHLNNDSVYEGVPK